MRIESLEQFEKLQAVIFEKFLRKVKQGATSASYWRNADVGALTHLARTISAWFLSDECVIVVTGTGAFPDSENVELFNAYRVQQSGNSASLTEARVHRLSGSEHVARWTLISMCLYFFWDFVAFDAEGSLLVAGSNDEYVSISTSDRRRLRQIVQSLERLKLQPRRVTRPRKKSAADRRRALSNILEELKGSRRGRRALERFGRRLFKLVPEIPGAEVIRAIRVVQRLAPHDDIVTEWVAKCLYASLYFEGEEKRSASVRRLFEQLERLKDTGNSVALQHYAMALRYRIDQEPRGSTTALLSWTTALRNLAQEWPEDYFIQSLCPKAVNGPHPC